MFDGARILVTGGTGSFGKRFISRVFAKHRPETIIVYSRDEYKQYLMRERFKEYDKHIRYFIGDVRDKERLYRAFDGVDYVIHAAALKQVPAAEYNPFEAVKTNINGAQNVTNAAIDRKVQKVVALSTDKSVNPVNLYGATKLASDKLFIAGNAYVGGSDTVFSVVRYGNVAGSRGSVIPYFNRLLKEGVQALPVTDIRMTRFWITLDEAVDLVFKALDESKGGETYIAKIPSFKIMDLVQALLPDSAPNVVGMREGEKLHEIMITEYDSNTTYEYDEHFIIYPYAEWWNQDERLTAGGKKAAEFFRYASDSNTEWLSVEQIKKRVTQLNMS